MASEDDRIRGVFRERAERRHQRRGRVARGRPAAARPDSPNVEIPMPPMPGGEGVAAAIAAIDVLIDRVDVAARNFVVQGAHDIEEQAKLNASTGVHPPGQGHIPGTGPGPNIVSGELRRSVTVGEPEPIPMGDGWTTTVGPAIIYGRAIELGMVRPPTAYRGSPRSTNYRRHPSFGGEYPYLRPARDEFETFADALFLDEVISALEF